MKKVILALTLLVIIIFLGRNLNPFSTSMFTFHDSTQPTRIQQFSGELKKLHIPPRIAPDMNYRLGFPVFNFYAPFPYWLTSSINLIGFDVTSSLKLSFLLAIITGFLGSFLFFRYFFAFFPSLLGGILYITSLYIPLNIFVRGNLAEIWFLALFPLTLFFIYRKKFLSTAVILSFLFTSHNILSLVSLPFIFFFIFLLENKKQNLLALVVGLLLTSYFWLPAIVEMKYVWAKEVATLTNFRDHFLCIDQFWQSSWGFGGSIPGCINDGMSFMVGKIQLVTAGLGILLFLLKRKTKYNRIVWFILTFVFLHIFLTLYQSKPIWELLSPILSIVQFPWRLIGPPIIGIAFFSVYFLNNLKIPFKNVFLTIVLIIVFVVNGKYFQGQEITKKQFENRFLSQFYIEKKAAYAVAEYLPKTIDYQYWRSLEKKKEIPMEFLAKSTIEPFDKNKQTPIEKASNIISLITLITLILWKTSKRKP